MSQPQPLPPSLWDLIETAQSLEGVHTLHLAVGRPPMARMPSGELQPIDPSYQVLTYKTVALLLSLVIEPEKWEAFERVGEGEVRLTNGGLSIRLNVFRNSEAWSAVVHL